MTFNPYAPVTADAVDQLVSNKVSEDRTLDYKRDIPAADEARWKKLVVPVSAFANTAGGVLLFGVQEVVNAEGKNTGVPEEIVGIGAASADEIIRQFEEVLARNIKPRVPGISISKVDCRRRHRTVGHAVS